MRLIDADALIGYSFKNPISYNAFVNLVKRQPTVDAVEVKHVHWGKEFDGNHWTVCSNCGCRFIETIWFNPRAYHYCPNCGAKRYEVTE